MGHTPTYLEFKMSITRYKIYKKKYMRLSNQIIVLINFEFCIRSFHYNI